MIRMYIVLDQYNDLHATTLRIESSRKNPDVFLTAPRGAGVTVQDTQGGDAWYTDSLLYWEMPRGRETWENPDVLVPRGQRGIPQEVRYAG